MRYEHPKGVKGALSYQCVPRLPAGVLFPFAKVLSAHTRLYVAANANALANCDQTASLSSLEALTTSRHLFRQQMREGLFPFFGCFGHAFKKNGLALYRPRMTGTVNFPPPWLRQVCSQFHGDRIVGWIKFFAHPPAQTRQR